LPRRDVVAWHGKAPFRRFAEHLQCTHAHAHNRTRSGRSHTRSGQGDDTQAPAVNRRRLTDVWASLVSSRRGRKRRNANASQGLSDPGLRDCIHNVVHTGIRDRACSVPYLCCILLACEVELADIEGKLLELYLSMILRLVSD
jgi:hypothetical protein